MSTKKLWPLRRVIAKRVFDEFIGFVEMGVPSDNACWLANISSTALKRWMRLGEEGAAPYDRIFEAVRRAESIAVANHVGNLNAAAQDPRQWRAAAWMLERLRPDVFSSSREAKDIDMDVEVIIGGESDGTEPEGGSDEA
jgi:hypothetical protein